MRIPIPENKCLFENVYKVLLGEKNPGTLPCVRAHLSQVPVLASMCTGGAVLLVCAGGRNQGEVVSSTASRDKTRGAAQEKRKGPY